MRERGGGLSYILGVDGGNSKTLAAVADGTGRVLGAGRGRSGSHQAVGLAAAMEHIRGAAERAFHMAGIEGETAKVASYCLAGADLPEDFELLRPALEGLGLAQRIELHNDTVAALRSGTDERNAVVVVLGAGMNAAGRNDRGEEIRLPGLGWISGDWGGGGAIAEEAVRLSVRAWDGRGQPTILQDMVLRALDIPDVESLIRELYFGWTAGAGPVTILQLVPLVFEAAELGDAVARDLVERVADEMAISALALVRRLELLRGPADVVLAGSVFRAEGMLLIETIRRRLHDAAPLARIVIPEVEPVIGAVLCGMDMLGIRTDEEVRRTMAESFEECSGKSGTQVMAP